jgi:hypothetical protein
MIGTQFVVDQAPRGGPPDTCPILNDVAGNLLLTRTLFGTVFVKSMRPEVACDVPFPKHICSHHSQDPLRPLRHILLLQGMVLSLYPNFEQMRWKMRT